jgi:hypothetical protein
LPAAGEYLRVDFLFAADFFAGDFVAAGIFASCA